MDFRVSRLAVSATGLGSISFTVTTSESVTVPVTDSESVMVHIAVTVTVRSFTRNYGLSFAALMFF
jgi:hypothetical protein